MLEIQVVHSSQRDCCLPLGLLFRLCHCAACQASPTILQLHSCYDRHWYVSKFHLSLALVTLSTLHLVVIDLKQIVVNSMHAIPPPLAAAAICVPVHGCCIF
jgi:hypothetical protein